MMRGLRLSEFICGLLVASCANGFCTKPVRSAPPLPACRPVRQAANVSLKVPAPKAAAPSRTNDAWTQYASAEGTITLAELQQFALERHPALKQAGFQVEQSKGEWLQAGLYPNPTLSYVGNEIGDADTAGRQGYQVQQRIVTGGKLDWNRSVAYRDVERARWQTAVQQQRVLNDVAVQFARTLAAQQNVKVVSRLVAVVKDAYRTAQRRFQAGDVAETDALQAELELRAVELLEQNAKESYAAARRELAALSGTSELPAGDLSGALSENDVALTFDDAWEDIRAGSPLLQAAQATAERALHRIQRERVKPIPDILVQAGTVYDDVDNQTLHNVQIGIPLPLFDRNQGRVSAAHAEWHRARENVARVELFLRRQLASAFRNYEVAHSQVRRYETQILPTAERTLALVLKTYDRGEIDFVRLLTAQRVVVENRLRWIRALGERRAAAAIIRGQLITGGLSAPQNVLK